MSNHEWQPGAASSANPNGNQGYDQQPAYSQANFQGQYNQPAGYPGGSMPPQKKSKTGLWVGIGCGALLLLALLIGGGVLAYTLLSGDDKKEVPASEVSAAEEDLKSDEGGKDDKGSENNNDGGKAPAPNPAPGGNGGDGGEQPGGDGGDNPQPGGKNIPQPMPQPGAGGNNPQPGGGGDNPQPGQGGGEAPQPGGGGKAASGNLPQQVGSTSLDPSFGDAGIGDVGGTYVSQDQKLFYVVSIISDQETQELFTKYGTAEKKPVGSWTCESATSSTHTCYKQNESGALVHVIATNVSGLSAEEVTAWGDEFISKMG